MVVEVQVTFPMFVVEDVGRKLGFLLSLVLRLSGSSGKRDWFVRRKVGAGQGRCTELLVELLRYMVVHVDPVDLGLSN